MTSVHIHQVVFFFFFKWKVDTTSDITVWKTATFPQRVAADRQ